MVWSCNKSNLKCASRYSKQAFNKFRKQAHRFLFSNEPRFHFISNRRIFPHPRFTITKHVFVGKPEKSESGVPEVLGGCNQSGLMYSPVRNVSRASCGSHWFQRAANWEKLSPMSSCPRAGNTNCALNVRDNRSVKFRKHCRRSSGLMPAVRVSASLQQVVTTSLTLVTYGRGLRELLRFVGKHEETMASQECVPPRLPAA